MKTVTTFGSLLVNEALPPELRDYSRVMDKDTVAKLMDGLAKSNPEQYEMVLQNLGSVAGVVAMLTGHTIGLKDLESVPIDPSISKRLKRQIADLEADRSLSARDRSNKIVELLDPVVKQHQKTVLDTLLKKENPLALEVISGSRGNIAQLNKMVGSPIMMLDQNDNPAPLLVEHSMSHGLTPAEYYAQSYGTRKGAISTKMCLAKGTKVLVDSGCGMKEIQQVVPGDVVFTLDPSTKELRSTRVVAVYPNGVKACRLFDFYGVNHGLGFSVMCTEDHKFHVENRKNRCGGLLPIRQLEHLADKEKSIKRSGKTELLSPTEAWTYKAGDTSRSLLHSNIDMFATGVLFSGERLKYKKRERELFFTIFSKYSMMKQVLNLKDLASNMENVKRTEVCWSMKTPLNKVAVKLAIDQPVDLVTELNMPRDQWCGLADVDYTITMNDLLDLTDMELAWFLAGMLASGTKVFASKYKARPRATLISTHSPDHSKMLVTLLFTRLGVRAAEVIDAYGKPNIRVLGGYGLARLLRFVHSKAYLLQEKMVKLLSDVEAELANSMEYGLTFSRSSSPKVTKMETYDIEVEDPVHAFLLYGGIQVSNSTADSGFLSKQLALASHRLVASSDDSLRPGVGLPVPTDNYDYIGAVLAKDTEEYKAGELVSRKMMNSLFKRGIDEVLVRSPLTDVASDAGIPVSAAGVREDGDLPLPGRQLGIGAVQTITEALSQGALNQKHCLCKGTKVMTAEAEAVAIEDLKVGDIVYGSDIRGRCKPSRILNVFDNGPRICKKYVFWLESDQDVVSIDATDDHVVLGRKAGTGEVNKFKLSEVDATAVVGTTTASSYELARLILVADPREERTYDIEIDHADHLFTLDNGMVVSNSGGAGGKRVGGFPLISQLVEIPQYYPDGAAYADKDGKVKDIQPAPQGGFHVTINDDKIYVPVGQDVTVKLGQTVEAGDILSDGVPNPSKVVQHKGIGIGRETMASILKDATSISGIKTSKRNIDILARALVNNVKITEESDAMPGKLPGDIVEYDRLVNEYEPRADSQEVDVDLLSPGGYLEAPLLSYSIGTRLTPSVVSRLKHYLGKSKTRALVNKKAPPFEPYMERAMTLITKSPDFLENLGSYYVGSALLKALHTGGSAQVESPTSFIPSLITGRDIKAPGLTPEQKEYAKNTKGPGGYVDDKQSGEQYVFGNDIYDTPLSLLK